MIPQKIALITGGSRGLGKDMALSFARRNVNVVLTYNTNEDQARQTVKEIEDLGIKAACLQLDMAHFHSLDGFAQTFSDILDTRFQCSTFDYLINNAGMGQTVPFTEVTEAIFDQFLNVHFKSVYFLTQKLLNSMNAEGCIVNISTGTTRFSNPGYSVYASMKGGIEVFTKYLAKELGTRNIRANVVAPGPVETDFNNAAIRSNPQLKAVMSNMTPLGRVGAPDDIGSVVAFLCSPEAKWINGQRIEVSGGINV